MSRLILTILSSVHFCFAGAKAAGESVAGEALMSKILDPYARKIKTLLLPVSFFLFQDVTGQSLTGSWYGKADVVMAGNTSNYLTEFNLKQKGNDVEGIFGYYFKDSYQSFFIRGTFNSRTRQVVFRNLPLLFHASSARTGIECPMNFYGTLMVSRVNSTLTGNFYTEPKYKYTCPELRVRMVLDNDAENPNVSDASTASGRRFWQPMEDDVVVSGYSLRESDTTPVSGTAALQVSAEGNITREEHLLVSEFDKRNNIYQKDIIVYDDSVLVSFYDNGDVDDDTISVFLNKKPILVRRGLSSRALNIYIGLDSTVEINELSMFADNLGRFPPNTALMVISDRQLRYEVYLSASLKQNASVRLRRAKRN